MIQEESRGKIVTRKLIRHRVSLTYPEVIDLEDKEVEKTINDFIQEEIYKMIIEQGYEEDYTKEFWGEYKVKLKEANILSMLVYINSYSKGAAHGLTAVKAINVDLSTGKVYDLQDLFIKNSDYIEKINEVIKEEIIEKNIPLLVEFETIDKKQDFYLTKDHLTIFFQLYEYTPYAYGIPEFEIPYTVLASTIEESNPMKAFIQ
ncbi:putative protein with DUF3298 domain [Clostridium aceticum]|uniref:DUF3298 domain-containing protein n=1 Tax=Clostridium aceticum TaxID=84022 RepID=A0A0G3W7T4_9CLOT|nr:DUF3298 and DUF4163 domain-containing protein [Clostridium aceticum]AKL94433.1 putative protein with DUF3298 domain [Clostridium aceticum]